MGTPVQFKYYITGETGSPYYFASQAADGVWTVTELPDATPLKHLPKNWEKFEFEYIRNLTYYGVFRSESLSMQFAEDGRAILQYLYGLYGIEAKVNLRIDQRQDDALDGDPINIWCYETVYNSQLDFTSYVDNKKELLINIKTYDGALKALIESAGDIEFNIPYFEPDGGGGWSTEALGMVMPGIKLPYKASFVSSAKPSSPLTVNNNTSGDNAQMAMVPNNTVNFIGNDLLSNFFEQLTQSARLTTTGFDNYSTGSGLMRYNGLENGAGFYSFDSVLTLDVASITYPNPSSGNTFLWELSIFPIGEGDVEGSHTTIASISFNNDSGVADGDMITVTSPSISIINTSIPVYEDKIQVLASQCTFVTTGATSPTTVFNSLEFSLVAQHSTDLRFPASPCLGFRPATLFNKIVNRINSVVTDPNGFAVPQGTYSGISAWLESLETIYDVEPANIIFTSGNALRVIDGVQYITISLNSFFKAIFAMIGGGLNIVTTDGVQTGINIDKLRYYFNLDGVILDLGSDVANFKVSPLLENVGNILKTGYSTKWQDFNQYAGNQVAFYGVDAFNFEQDYKLPITKIRKDIDWTTSIIAEQYKIESARAMQNESAASSPSSSNEVYVVHINTDSSGTYDFRTPTGEVYTMDYYTPKQYEFIQDTDPTTPVYGRGMLFGETAINLGLTPSRCSLRKGELLHSYLTGMDSLVINFIKQYWQLRNGNSNIELAGIATNISGDLITEVADINIADLDVPLFKSYIYEFETQYPVNLYKILNDTPYGLISFSWNGQTYKGYVWEAKQMMATQQVTTFKLVAYPDSPI